MIETNYNNPFISIIVPLYNKEDSIGDTINSILSQDFDNFEILIINDGSTDDSLRIIENFEDSRIKIFSQKNKGISFSRNRGIKEATGNWVMFLDADDKLLTDGLMQLMSNIEDEETIVAGNFIVNNKNKHSQYLSTNVVKIYDVSSVYKAMVLKQFFMRAGSFIMPIRYARNHLYDININRFEDMKYFVECYENLKIKYIPQCVMSYEIGFNSASKPNQKKWNQDYGFHLDFEKNNFWKNCLMGDVLNNAICCYPTMQNKLQSLYPDFYKFHTYAKILNFLIKIKRKFFNAYKNN